MLKEIISVHIGHFVNGRTAHFVIENTQGGARMQTRMFFVGYTTLPRAEAKDKKVSAWEPRETIK